jgi:nitrogen fixation/metabolism regulation signal transduction histidine kinase
MKRSIRVAINLAAFIASCTAIALLALLIVATSQASEFDRYYKLLYGINIAVALMLAVIVIGFSARLALRWRQGKFGSKLLTKIAVIFVLIGAIPGLVIYVVSYQFVSRSIESWFDVKVEAALEAGLNLGRSTLDELQNDFLNQVRANAPQAQDEAALTPLALERLRQRLDAAELVAFSASSTANRVIATAGGVRISLMPELPSAAVLSKVRPSRGAVSTESLGEESSKLRMRAILVLANTTSGLELGTSSDRVYLQVLKNVPDSLAKNALAVQQANSEYQTRAAARKDLKRLYLGTLTLALFLALFAALLMAVLLSNQIARPMLLLAQGVKAVADGDLSPKAQSTGRDELGGLTRDFNRMTTQLADARRLVL